MTTRTLIKEILAALLLAAVIFAPRFAVSAQSPAPAANPVMNLPAIVKASPGVLGIETAQTESGKLVIFAWFENKKAALTWYYSQAHQSLMKMAGGGSRSRTPMADVPDDGRPIMAIASLTLAKPAEGIPQSGLPAVSQIAIELYAPLPGGLAAGGRFAPTGVAVPGLASIPTATLPSPK
jgi:hypothetical protein